MDAGLRSDDLEQPRNDVDLDVVLPELVDRVEQLIVRGLREGDDHPFDVEQLDERVELVRLADQREVLELGPAFPRIRVDEPDEVDAVLGMLHELARGELSDVTGTEDDRVLEIERTAPRSRTGEPAE